MKLAPALRNYLKQAMSLHKSGSIDRAMQMYRDVLAQDPLQADALHLLGGAHFQKGELDEAESLMRRAIDIWDEAPGYFNDLGNVLATKKKYVEAIGEYKSALKIDPKFAKAINGLAAAYGNRGIQLSREHNWEQAEQSYLDLLKIRPGDPAGLNNLAEIYQHGGDRKKAYALYSEALAAKPGFSVAHYNRAICNLCIGNLEQGWADLAESAPGWLPVTDKRANLPWQNLSLWDGSDLRGKKILIWGDQGIGDEVLFASMIPDLISRGAQITVECTDRLAPIFARSFPEISVVARRSPAVPGNNFDFQAPGLWLGRWLRKDFTKFPAQSGYIKADAQETEKLRARYMAFGKSKVIGISWHSTSSGRAEHRRMALHDLIAALPLEDTLYVSLQYGDHIAECEEAKRAYPHLNLFVDPEIDQLKNMDSFAAQISSCDKVISIGNTTAHVAGALGVVADIFLPISGLTWYWFESRNDCPWYPQLRLLRKEQEGEWNPALRRIVL